MPPVLHVYSEESDLARVSIGLRCGCVAKENLTEPRFEIVLQLNRSTKNRIPAFMANLGYVHVITFKSTSKIASASRLVGDQPNWSVYRNKTDCVSSPNGTLLLEDANRIFEVELGWRFQGIERVEQPSTKSEFEKFMPAAVYKVAYYSEAAHAMVQVELLTIDGLPFVVRTGEEFSPSVKNSYIGLNHAMLNLPTEWGDFPSP